MYSPAEAAMPEAHNNNLTGHSRKTTLVLVVMLATIAMGSLSALWSRERILYVAYGSPYLRAPCWSPACCHDHSMAAWSVRKVRIPRTGFRIPRSLFRDRGKVLLKFWRPRFYETLLSKAGKNAQRKWGGCGGGGVGASGHVRAGTCRGLSGAASVWRAVQRARARS
jgi:hypothetical protein